MNGKFDQDSHKFGYAYIAYKKPYKGLMIYPEKIEHDADTGLYWAYYCSGDYIAKFIDMTRSPEHDYVLTGSQYIMDNIDPNEEKSAAHPRPAASEEEK